MANNLSSEIAAPGRVITLIDGTEVTIRYGFGAIKALEDHFGSINALMVALSKAADGSLFTDVAFALWAGTSRKVPADDFYDLLDTRHFSEYLTTFSEAIAEAMGVSEGEAPAVEETATAS